MFNFFIILVDKLEIESIVNTTLDVRRKKMYSKFFQNPINAEILCYILGMVAFFAIGMTVFFLITYSSDETFIDSLLNTINCESLKHLHTSLDLSLSQEKQVTQHMLIQCL